MLNIQSDTEQYFPHREQLEFENDRAKSFFLPVRHCLWLRSWSIQGVRPCIKVMLKQKGFTWKR